MSWVRLDDTFPEHPKIVALSMDARWEFLVGLCYASRYLTDGFIPASVVARDRKAVDELVRVGLWAPTGDGDGYRIHDYLDFQRSRADVEEQRKRQSEGGRRGARKRWVTDDEDL